MIHIIQYLYEPYASNINSGKNKFFIRAAGVSLVMLSTADVICAFSSSACQEILLSLTCQEILLTDHVMLYYVFGNTKFFNHFSVSSVLAFCVHHAME